MEGMKKFINVLVGTRAAAIYILLFAFAIAVATFIENDFGTSSAQKLVFRAKWFELILFLFSLTLIANIFRFKMIPQKRWALFSFHLAMVIILIGSAITRYFSYEGVMHIRENQSENTFLSAETFLNFSVIKNSQKYLFDEQVLFATLGRNKWSGSYSVDGDIIELKIDEFIPNPEQTLVDDANGTPILKIVTGGQLGRKEHLLKLGNSSSINGLLFNFGNHNPEADINITYPEERLKIASRHNLTRMTMATREIDSISANNGQDLAFNSLYTLGSSNFVFNDFREKGVAKLISTDAKVRNESMTALRGTLSINGQSSPVTLYGKKGLVGSPEIVNNSNLSVAVSYGAKPIQLPFQLKLYKFILEKYPGTNSASSYASEIQLIDNEKNVIRDKRIYMNHILNYRGYRFFQSSFDQDEKGTYLSVNHDFWGTWVSYFGYFLLTLGMIFSFFSKKSRFYQLSQKIKRIRNRATAACIVFLFVLLPGINFGQNPAEFIDPLANPVDSEHAQLFSTLIVQDHNGRMKPVHTMNREFVRKIFRKESYEELNADQVILGMFSNPDAWKDVKFIKLGKHKDINDLLNVDSEYATYNDFFSSQGYILREEVRRAYNLQPIDRGVFEKELMKIDERVNIVNMIFTGRMLKIIPVPGSEDNTWLSTQSIGHNHSGSGNELADRFFNAYVPVLRESTQTGDYNFVNTLINELKVYQKENGQDVIPSNARLNAEILLNNSNVFGRLAFIYFILGLAFLFGLFASIFSPGLGMKRFTMILFSLVILAFIFHTFGLGMRWFVSGRAPWSNGYESMIYIAWTSTLAGILFTRKSLGGLAATMILSATVLLVAMLSYLDPEITPLVPVLKSYWLTIHVSLEAGSYGFLMLGAIIGLLNLILYIFMTSRNKERIHRIIKEMSYISEMTLIGGIVMVSVGTYLGGVWANESWGRYWGWDAKETWALVTILVYAFILHMRLVPKLGGLYAFNLATLFGWGSVIMTYYGVNYYLSGLHSYASGDPIPIPMWVYYAVAGLVVISILAYWKKRRIGV